MKEHECSVVIKMKKKSVTKVSIVTCTGVHTVVTTTVPFRQPFTVPIMTVDGVISLWIKVV